VTDDKENLVINFSLVYHIMSLELIGPSRRTGVPSKHVAYKPYSVHYILIHYMRMHSYLFTRPLHYNKRLFQTVTRAICMEIWHGKLSALTYLVYRADNALFADLTITLTVNM
jgi:hypothetical protein